MKLQTTNRFPADLALDFQGDYYFLHDSRTLLENRPSSSTMS